MQVQIEAQITKVQAKPPKLDKDGVPEGGPRMQVVLESDNPEALAQIGDLARYLGMDVKVTVDSYQLHFDDVAAAASKAMSSNGATAKVTYNRTLGE